MTRRLFLTSAALCASLLGSAPAAMASSYYGNDYGYPYYGSSYNNYGYDDYRYGYNNDRYRYDYGYNDDRYGYDYGYNDPYRHGSYGRRDPGGERYEDFRCFHKNDQGICTNYQYRQSGYRSYPYGYDNGYSYDYPYNSYDDGYYGGYRGYNDPYWY